MYYPHGACSIGGLHVPSWNAIQPGCKPWIVGLHSLAASVTLERKSSCQGQGGDAVYMVLTQPTMMLHCAGGCGAVKIVGSTVDRVV